MTKKSGDLKIEQWPIAKVLPYAKNARLHSADQVKAIAASITEFGFVNPCLIDGDGVLIAGHGRVLASKFLNRKTVPVIRLGHLSETQAMALRLADNQLPMLASWSTELLQTEIGQLKLDGYNIELLGFPEIQLRSMGIGMGPETGNDPEETPEPPKNPVSRLGDVWVLGKHRLLCGSSTEKDDVAKVLKGGVKPNLMVTDPPYGVSYDPAWRDRQLQTWTAPIALGAVQNDNQADWRDAYSLFPGDVLYVWSAGLRSRQSVEAIEAVDFEIRAQIIWAKPHFLISRGHYHFQHEPCWYAVRKGKTASWNGDRAQSTLWHIDNNSAFGGGKRSEENKATGHGTQKPIECMKRPIENNSKAGDAIYEPFSGSGTTIIAGEMTGRRVYAIELDPAYVDVACLRFEKFSGKKVVLEATGKTFADTAKDRQKRAPAAQKKTPAAKAGVSAKAAVGAQEAR